MKLDKKNKIQDNIQLYHDKNGLNIYNPDFFLTFSDFNISDGIDIIENILILKNDVISLKNTDKVFESIEKFMASNNIEGSYIFHNFDNIEYFVNTYGDISVVTVVNNDVEIEDFTVTLRWQILKRVLWMLK